VPETGNDEDSAATTTPVRACIRYVLAAFIEFILTLSRPLPSPLSHCLLALLVHVWQVRPILSFRGE